MACFSNRTVQYVADVDNLCLMMNLLKDPSRSIQFEAFHVFKVKGRRCFHQLLRIYSPSVEAMDVVSWQDDWLHAVPLHSRQLTTGSLVPHCGPPPGVCGQPQQDAPRG
jgi:hypothetical protein